MEKECSHSFQFSLVVFVYVVLIGLVNGSADERLHLDGQLRAIRYAQRNEDTNLSILETACLNLVADHNLPWEKGKIYATIALVYSDRGYGLDDDPNRVAKTYQYSIKALAYPLDPLLACHMYTRGSDAIVAQSRRDPNLLFAEAREKAIDLCLKGLKLALDNNARKEYPKAPPAFVRIETAPDTPVEHVIKLYNRQVEAREKWLNETEFCGLRQGLFTRCLSFYACEPNDRDAFRKKVRKILKGHEDVAGELMMDCRIQSHRRRAEPAEEGQ